jgi:hypothetical protein
MLASAAPAPAGWVEKTADWIGQIDGGGRLITDEANDDLYYIDGNSIKKYDPPTDTWTDKTSATSGGYSAGDNYTIATYVDGEFLLKNHMRDYVDVYDIAADSWSTSNLPTGGGWEHSWSQGAVYNTVDGQFWCFWTDKVDPDQRGLVGAAYDRATDTWGAPAEYVWPSEGHWGRMENVNIGTTNYVTFDNGGYVGQNVKIRTYDFTQAPPVPTGETVETSVHDLGAGNALAVSTASAFGVQCMAVHNGLIYLSGMNQSGEFVVYDPVTDTWQDLDSFNNAPGGYRNHSTAAMGNAIYVQDSNEFWVYDLGPGPLQGDVDGNGVVNGLDLTAVLTAWDTIPGDALWNPDADLDGNNVINGLDLTEVISNWTVASAAAAPEPPSAGASEEDDAGPRNARRGKGNAKKKKK